MKVVIGKRDGLVIVSGGGSLEEQKNNLKDWEILDTESGALKEDIEKKEEVQAKKFKIDPEDIYISLTNCDAGITESLFHGAYQETAGIIPASTIENKQFWDETKKAYRKTSELNNGIGISNIAYAMYSHDYVRLYKPILEDGVYKIVIPYVKSIDGGSGDVSMLRSNPFLTVHLGNPVVYGKEAEGGGENMYYSEHNFTALRKKYGIGEIEGFNNSDNDFAVVPIKASANNNLAVPSRISIDFDSEGEHDPISGTFSGVMYSNIEASENTLGKTLMPDQSNALGKLIELPEIKIEIAALKENP